MALLHAIAVVLLSLFAYSAGAAAEAGAERSRPEPIDVATAPLAAAALLVAALHGAKPTGLLVAVLGGLLAGLSVGRIAAAPTAEGGPPPSGPDRRPGSEEGWRRYLLRVGNFQGRLFLSLFYFLLLPPFALIARLSPDPSGSRAGPGTRSGYRSPVERPGGDDLRAPY